MSMKESLQGKLTDARREKNKTRLGLLQVILGEVSTQEARGGKLLTDEQIEGVVRKLAEGNYTTLALVALGDKVGDEEIKKAAKKIAEADRALLAVVRAKNRPEYERVVSEDGFLMTLLPKTLSVERIKENLAEVADAIKAAKNDGQATGVAMKHAKAKGLKVLGDQVAQAVKELRG